jgi:hypothetical protein
VNTRLLIATAVTLGLAGGLAGGLAASATGRSGTPTDPGTVTVTVTGGHDTVPVDHGRPVVLIAAMLDLPPAVFREAFSRVQPASAGSAPEPVQVGRNKAALLDTLGRYGVTNERLDEVSNYYRYDASAGRLWRTRAADIRIVLRHGRVVGVTIVDGGAGYTSPPLLSVPDHPGIRLTATLAFSGSFATNGRITSVTVDAAEPDSR